MLQILHGAALLHKNLGPPVAFFCRSLRRFIVSSAKRVETIVCHRAVCFCSWKITCGDWGRSRQFVLQPAANLEYLAPSLPTTMTALRVREIFADAAQ